MSSYPRAMFLHKLDRYRDVGLLIIRIGLGLSFIFVHGMRKFFGGPEVWERYGDRVAYIGIEFLPTLWGFMAGLSEFIGGLLLLLGLLFRPTLFLLICTMIVAAAYHIGSGNGSPWHALELGIVFIGLFLTGPGRFSLDEYIDRRRRMGF